jgi:hypothetical protein
MDRPRRFAILVAAASSLAGASADAKDCVARWGGGSAVPGTLASPPAQPCPPTPPAAPVSPQAQDKPGTFRQGNTTIHFGGSISTEVGVGGRRGR